MTEDWEIPNIQRFVTNYRDKFDGGYAHWKLHDDVLYGTFSKYPHHDKLEEVLTKVALVNRVYFTQLEKANDAKKSENAEYRIADEMRGKVDSLIDELPPPNDFDGAWLQGVVHVHEQLLDIVHKATGRLHVSFCSKYLHFHAPNVVPIFDSKVSAVAKRLAQAETQFCAPSFYGAERNADYTCYCGTVLNLFVKKLRENGIKDVNLKRIDFVLYRAGGGRA